MWCMAYPIEKVLKPLSYRQMRAVELWVKYGRKSKARALREAGYSRSVVRQPRKVFSSPAVREELDKRGFGFNGLHNNLDPHAKPIAVIRPSFDFSALTEDDLRSLKEKLENAPDVPLHTQFRQGF